MMPKYRGKNHLILLVKFKQFLHSFRYSTLIFSTILSSARSLRKQSQGMRTTTFLGLLGPFLFLSVQSAKPKGGESGNPVKLLVFGDSWGSFGPSWREMADMFKRHNVTYISYIFFYILSYFLLNLSIEFSLLLTKVSATVKNSAVGGTRACEWARDPNSLVNEAKKMFPSTGPDYIWYTLGGNDMEDHDYHDCSKAAKNFDEQLKCQEDLTWKVSYCFVKEFISKTKKRHCSSLILKCP